MKLRKDNLLSLCFPLDLRFKCIFLRSMYVWLYLGTVGTIALDQTTDTQETNRAANKNYWSYRLFEAQKDSDLTHGFNMKNAGRLRDPTPFLHSSGYSQWWLGWTGVKSINRTCCYVSLNKTEIHAEMYKKCSYYVHIVKYNFCFSIAGNTGLQTFHYYFIL